MIQIKNFILDFLQKKYSIDKDIDLNSFHYIEEGYVDSLSIIQFIIELEEEFSISFTDEEVCSPEFKTIGGLIQLIEGKVKNDEKP